MITKPVRAPQSPQQPQQPLQLSRKRYDFLESIPPCCGGCAAAEEKKEPEVGRETAATVCQLRLPYLTTGGVPSVPILGRLGRHL